MAIKKQTLIKAFLLIIIVLAVLFTSAWFFVSYQLSHLDKFKGEIMAAASKALQRDFSFENGEAALIFPDGVNAQFTNVMIKEKDKSAEFVKIPGVFFRMDILPLLRGKIILQEVIINQPQLLLKRDRSGALNIADFLAGEKKKQRIEPRKIIIKDGMLTFLDQAAGAKDLITSLTNLSFHLDMPGLGKKSSFRIAATVNEEKNQGKLALAGTFLSTSREKPLTESIADFSFRLKEIDLHHYQPYLASVPIKQLAGHVDLDAIFSGTLLKFQSRGAVAVSNGLLDYPQAFRGPLQPQNVFVDYALNRDKSNLQLDIARLAIDKLKASGSFALRDMGQADPVLTATAVTSTFSLKEARPYIPWKIIPENVGSFIDTHIENGNFRLVEGKLNGRKSRIMQMEKPENAGVLFIMADVNKGVFMVNKETPVFQDISGKLELKNRQFLLKSMKGRFGSSPCALEGKISDFALPEPVVYTAEMILQPDREEVIWLFGKEKFRDFKFQGISSLRLSGKGPADDFHVDANWDLTDVRYVYPEVLEKPRGKTNLLKSDFALNKDAVNVFSYRYELPEIAINGTASYSYDKENPLTLEVISNKFDIRKIISILPFLKPYYPAGTFRINVTGHGNPKDSESLSLKGNVSLADVSLKFPQNIKPIRGLTGLITFKDKRVETSHFKANVGESAVTGKCAVDNFGNPQVACQFASPVLHTIDVGWQSPDNPVDFQNVEGLVKVKDNLIQVEKLDLKLGKSRLSLSGKIRDFAEPKITLFLHSPYIDYEDIFPLTSLKKAKKKKESSLPGREKEEEKYSAKAEIDASIQVDAGTIKGVNFNKLNSNLNLMGETLNVDKLEMNFFDGKITGSGKVNRGPDGSNNYTAVFFVDKISLDKIQTYFERKTQIITGTLSLTGNVSAMGSNADDLQKTAKGKFQVKAGKGVLEEFSVLSKIFSLLNVVQLAKFQLPDMAKGGMPYNTITGDLSLADGIVSSKNFFIDSDAMQISAAGKVDLQKKELDNIVGVHPLHTLDKIVARIPVAGWLLTDKKGNLITVHFKVDGKWGDPSVTPIPVQSVAEGTLDIFRRLFKLPEKLVTDTGEVILGH